MSILNNLNDEQRKAAKKVEGSSLILAGAGSGKTRTVTYKIAYMVKELNINPSSILALTFTNKAAKELELRINEKLEELNKSVDEINNSMTGFIELFSKFRKSFNGVLANFDENSVTLKEAGSSLAEITASIKEQDITIREGFLSLKKIDNFLRDTSTILDAVQTSHEHLGTLLQQS